MDCSMGCDTNEKISHVLCPDARLVIQDGKLIGHHGLKVRRSHKDLSKVCAVCGDHAMGYNFDAVTCESCKAFFRRNALKDEDYHRCTFTNNCEITPISRRFCQKCRLAKCFQVGMKKEWIEDDDKLIQRKQKRIEKNRKSSCPGMGKFAPYHLCDRRMSSNSGALESDQSHNRSPSASPHSIHDHCDHTQINDCSSPCLDDCSPKLGNNGDDESRDFSKCHMRESVIRRLPSILTPDTGHDKKTTHEQVTQYVCPSLHIHTGNEDKGNITISKSILNELLSACENCFAQSRADLPPVVRFVRELLTDG